MHEDDEALFGALRAAALATADEIGQLIDTVRALDGLAQAEYDLGRTPRANPLWRRALELTAECEPAAVSSAGAGREFRNTPVVANRQGRGTACQVGCKPCIWPSAA